MRVTREIIQLSVVLFAKGPGGISDPSETGRRTRIGVSKPSVVAVLAVGANGRGPAVMKMGPHRRFDHLAEMRLNGQRN